MDHQEWIVAIGAIVGACMSGMQVLGKWREERRNEAQIGRKIEQAEKRVSFLESWRKSQSAISSQNRQETIDRYVARELDVLLADTLYTANASGNSILDSSRRYMLLFLPRSFWGWLSRFGFFLSFPIFLAFVPFFMVSVGKEYSGSTTVSPKTTAVQQTVENTSIVQPTSQPQEPTPDFTKMTTQDYAKYIQERRATKQKGGVLISNTLPIQSSDATNPEVEVSDVAAGAAVLIIIGSFSLFCYIAAVWDGRETKKVVTERPVLPNFLQYLDNELEIVDEEEYQSRAA